MPGTLPSIPMLAPIPSIICFMKRNFCTSSVTCCSGCPEPLAMRVTRPGSRVSA